jgi:hypothetical protein
MMRRQRVTFFTADDDTVPVIGAATPIVRADGSVDVVITDPSFTTDPTHPRGVLCLVNERGESTINLRDGTGDIGTTTVEILDRPEIPGDQQSGIASRVLPDVAAGARAVLEEETGDDTGVYERQADLVAGDAQLNETKTGYLVPLRDAQEATREVRAFVRAETTTILPLGVVDGYGRVAQYVAGAPSQQQVTYVIPPSPPLTAIFYRDAGGVDADAGYLFRSGRRWNDYRMDWDAFEATVMPRLSAGPAFSGLSGYEGRRFDGVVVRWRVPAAAGYGVPGNVTAQGPGPWVYCRNMPLLDRFPGTTLLEDKVWHPFYQTDKKAVRRGPFGAGSGAGYVAAQMNVDKESRLVGALIAVALTRTTGDTSYALPAHNQEVEFQVIAGGEPTDDHPALLELPAADLFERTARGDYGDEASAVRLSLEGMARFRAATSGIILRVFLTSPVDNLRTWWRDNIFKPLRWALAVNNVGELEPVSARIPAAGVALPVITDDDCDTDATWVRPASQAVTGGEFTYYRDFVAPQTGVAPSDSHYLTPLQRLTSAFVKYRDISIRGTRLLGRQEVTIDATTVRTVTTMTDAEAVLNLDASTEEGHQLAVEGISQLIERFPNHGQVVELNMRLTRPALAALTRGDFVVVGISYLPDGETKRRGLNRLMQVVSRGRLNHRWAHLVLDDVGDGAEQPLAAPQLANLQLLDDGTVTVDVVYVPVDGAARVGVLVEAATGQVQPPEDAGDWGLVSLPQRGEPSPAAPYTVAIQPPPAGGSVYVRASSTRPGRRPSAPSAVLSLTVPGGPRLQAFTLGLVEQPDGTVVARASWRANAETAGVRVYWVSHLPDDDIPAAATVLAGAVVHAPTLTAGDAAGTGAVDLGPVALGGGVAALVVPYSAYAAGAVPPAGGTAGPASAVLVRDRPAAAGGVVATIGVRERPDLATVAAAAFDVVGQATLGALVTIERRQAATVDALAAVAWAAVAGPAASRVTTTNAVARTAGTSSWVEYRTTAPGADPAYATPVRVSGQAVGGGGGGGGAVPPAFVNATSGVTSRGTSCAPVENRGTIGWDITFDGPMPAGWSYTVNVQGYEFGPFTAAAAAGSVAGEQSGGFGAAGGTFTMDLAVSWAIFDGSTVRASGTAPAGGIVDGWLQACLIGS